jgi:hypothetical protein
MVPKIFIISAVRSAIGDFGGIFRGTAPVDLVTPIMRVAVERSGLQKEAVGKVILGNTLAPINPKYSPNCLNYLWHSPRDALFHNPLCLRKCHAGSD